MQFSIYSHCLLHAKYYATDLDFVCSDSIKKMFLLDCQKDLIVSPWNLYCTVKSIEYFAKVWILHLFKKVSIFEAILLWLKKK